MPAHGPCQAGRALKNNKHPDMKDRRRMPIKHAVRKIGRVEGSFVDEFA